MNTMNSIFGLGLEENIIKEKYLKSIINDIFDYVVIVDKEYKIIYFHKKTYFVLGGVMEEGKQIYDYIDELDKENFNKDFIKALQGMVVEREKKLRTVNNNVCYIMVKYTPVLLNRGEINGVCITYKDMTSQKISESHKSKNSENLKKILDEKRSELKILNEEYDNIVSRYNSLYNNIRDLIFTVELSYDLKENKLVKASSNFFRELGYLEIDIGNLSFENIVRPNENSIDNMDILINKLIENENAKFQGLIIAKDKALIPFEFEAHATRLNNRYILTIIGKSLVEKIAKEEKIRQRLGKDQITDTLNRVEGLKVMDEYVKSAIINKETISITYLDINDMNKINYKFGHITGDKVLKEFADIVVNNIPKDAFFFRIDGDEFVIYEKNKSKDTILNIITKIKKELAKINESDRYRFDINFRYGLAVFDGVIDIDLDKLIYIAKKDMLTKK